MAIDKQLYQEIEDVVGSENICDDPIMGDAYRSRFLTVVLPANTEQVQAVVRLCNKYKQPFKGISTGWSFAPPCHGRGLSRPAAHESHY